MLTVPRVGPFRSFPVANTAGDGDPLFADGADAFFDCPGGRQSLLFAENLG